MKYIVKNNNEYHLIQAEGFVPQYEEVYECPDVVENVNDIDIVDGIVILNPNKKIMRLETEKKLNNNYRMLRQKAYPSIQEQLDMLYHDMVNNTNNWKDKITQIKKQYPKK
jgi:hypothetical protein